jgi:DNA-binding response OmpR family regulator
MKLLLVEDNLHLATDMSKFLTDNGFVVEQAANLNTARERVSNYEYDLIILDLGLPDGNGLHLIDELKQKKINSGILIVTAKNGIKDKVKGLELGADDYITKPFHKSELNARIRSIIRRGKFNGNNVISIGDLRVDVAACQVNVNEQVLNLTRKEYDLLLYFIYNKNRVLTKESIAEHLWGDHIDQADSFDFIYNHIKNLRKKIISAGGNDHIESMYGMGYKFCERPL